MKQSVYSIYDSKAEAFLEPQFSHNNATALRSFQELANDPKSFINRHPSDYTLFHIGEWNASTGDIDKSQVKTALGIAIELQNGEPSNG